MKVLIGYDGSPSAGEALEDLKRAGLPGDTEVLVVTAGNVWMPPPNIEIYQAALTSRRVAGTMAQLQNQAERTLKEAEEMSGEAAARIKSDFPDWTVGTEIMSGDAGGELIKKAADWQADLIVVGSQNRSAVGRFFLGSVSRKVVTEANCSVRVTRALIENDKNAPRRAVVGIENAETADLIVEQIARREWTKDSVITLVTATSATEKDGISPVKQIIDAQEIQQSAKSKLAASGLKILTTVKAGDAKSVLLAEAETLSADCIFVGSRDVRGTINRFLLGSVSTGVVTDAPCSVEVVRANAN
jgi:nucleotide-binding universal stress UspA family protein